LTLNGGEIEIHFFVDQTVADKIEDAYEWQFEFVPLRWNAGPFGLVSALHDRFDDDGIIGVMDLGWGEIEIGKPANQAGDKTPNRIFALEDGSHWEYFITRYPKARDHCVEITIILGVDVLLNYGLASASQIGRLFC
jgi:hypothetical protein